MRFISFQIVLLRPILLHSTINMYDCTFTDRKHATFQNWMQMVIEKKICWFGFDFSTLEIPNTTHNPIGYGDCLIMNFMGNGRESFSLQWAQNCEVL